MMKGRLFATFQRGLIVVGLVERESLKRGGGRQRGWLQRFFATTVERIGGDTLISA